MAVEVFLKDFLEIQLIESLMKKLSTPLNKGNLMLTTDLVPIVRNDTRWTGCFKMVKRFFELEAFIDCTNPELAALMPTHPRFHEKFSESKLSRGSDCSKQGTVKDYQGEP